MSVYKRPGSKTYSYDFQLNGHRFSGDTGATSKRKALEHQEVVRSEAKASAKSRPFAGRDIGFGEAAARYMVEVGQHHKNALTTLASMEWLEAAIGKATPISAVTDDLVARLVAKRRAEHRRVGNKNTPKKLVGPATVNRTMTEPLRKVMTRAARVWKVPVVPILWNEHFLTEPKERIREASIGEEAAVLGQLSAGYDVAMRFAFLNGCRRMEVVGLEWPRVDFFGRQFTVIGKGRKSRVIPMSDETFQLLWEERGRHETAVFTYVARRTDSRKKLVRGKRYPITEAGLREASRRAIRKAGVENLRFHDTRHTAATRVLRKSNMKVVQNLLGHERITTTEKYAHALAEDVRAALNAASPTKNPTKGAADPRKAAKRKG
ncbi:integrase [Youhaiella tibetensis]|uniref:Site-specific integrase n=1 Tax=Paradevosia tibetensis TaxID=1447062 RepID=A0A5B9DMQ3_9HYPH|nr:site-specific integrase [Youhaiella tibetensis]QEE20383.1 site-specific integrase [Youhaiella tibetensis]GGF24675.1 integrase [Youhaiella tibetensis]